MDGGDVDGGEDGGAPDASDPDSSAPGGDGDGDGDGDGEGEGDAGASSLREQLEALGIPTERDPFLDKRGEPLPHDYSPLGPTLELGRRDELFVMGLIVESAMDADAVAVVLDDVSADPALGVLDARQRDAWPFASDTLDDDLRPGTIRAATAGDFDADGNEDIAVVYFDAAAEELRVMLLRAADDGDFAQTDLGLLEEVEAADHLRAISGDFDGDGVDELVVARSVLITSGDPPAIEGSRTELLRAVLDDDSFDVVPAPPAIAGRLRASSMTVELSTARLDDDNPEELIVLANERAPSGGNAEVAFARARYFVYDDANAGFEVVRASDLVGEDENGIVRSAVVGGVTTADVDRDGRDEIILAGSDWDSTFGECDNASNRFLVMVIDDRTAAFVPIAATHTSSSQYHRCPDDVTEHVRGAVHVHALDVEGDGELEIAVDDRVMHYDPTSAEPFSNAYEMSGMYAEADYDLGTSALVVLRGGHGAGDRLASYSIGRGEIAIWGFVTTPVEGISKVEVIPVTDDGAYPVLVGANLNRDGTVVDGQVVDGEQTLELLPGDDDQVSEYVITEPMLLAVLAAPPCEEELGQDTEACVTSFGESTSIGLAMEESLKLSAKAGIGFEIMGGALTQSEIEGSVNISIAGTVGTSQSSTRTTSVTYTTGPLEDTVVYAALPYSRFLYRVRSAFDATLVGSIVEVMVPGKAFVRQASREFFDAHVEDDDDKVPADLFVHTPGQVSSYLDRDALLEHMDDVCSGCSPLSAGPQAVGQGSGETEIALEIATEQGLSSELEIEASVELETTIASVKVTAEFGSARAWGIEITAERGTSYTGSVSSLDAEHFADHGYAFGLLTYTAGSRPPFQVVDYWVE